ncbi:MAG: cobalamin B12-binding domain-containing protein [candidate division Zixibacteria bacterium]|nr:cobalamin B12-binding domain-containing protein [candidate division Zixibacteria bacterium]
MEQKFRILLAKPGLDGHDRGIKVIAAALRDGGFEVIYTGLRQTPEQIVEAALQEDVDAIGMSILSGAHMTLFPAVLKLMKENGIDDMLLFGGGIVSDNDADKLKGLGCGKIFGPGTPTPDVVKYLQDTLPGHRKRERIF